MIRRVHPEEAGRLRELRLRALADSPHAYFGSVESEAVHPLSYWRDWTDRDDKVMFVAEEGGEWIGMSGAFVHLQKPGTVGLWWMWIAPAARGRGVAGALFAASADWARAQGATRLELAAAEDNEASLAFCKSLGFVPTGERRTMASDPRRAGIFLALPLTPSAPATPADQAHPRSAGWS